MSCQGHGGRESMTPDNTPRNGVELPRPCPSVCTHHTGGGTLEFFTPVPVGNSSGGCCTHVISYHCPPSLRSWWSTHLYKQLSQEPRVSQDLSACRRLFSHRSYLVPELIAPFLQAGYGKDIVCHKLGPSQPVPRVWQIIGWYGVWTTERSGFQ